MKFLEFKKIKMSIHHKDDLWRNWWVKVAGSARSHVESGAAKAWGPNAKIDIEGYWPRWQDVVKEPISEYTPSYKVLPISQR